MNLILKDNIFLTAIILFFSIMCLGFLNSSWYSLLYYQLLFCSLYSARLNKEINKWSVSLLVIIICIVVKINLNVPQILEGSNVFIGGEKYDKSIFKNELPEKIFTRMQKDYIEIFPNSISGPDIKTYHKSVNQILKKTNETRLIESINWENRHELQLGAFNNTRYNAYGKQEPNRKNLPFFVKYTFPIEYNNSKAKFCWEGIGYIGKELEERDFKEFSCIGFNNTNANEKLKVWLLETGKTLPLRAQFKMPLKYQVMIYIKNLLTIFSSLLIIILLFKNYNLKKILFYGTIFLINIIFSFYFYPDLIFRFILFEGGNDGLLYVHFAHMISSYLSEGNYILAFMGGEKAYDLMPFYRYIWVANYILFGESPWMLYFIITFLPLIIYNILKQLLDKRWANYFMLFWFFIPILEAFGFFHFYYVKLTIRGFGEPLSYLFFLTALYIFILIHKSKDQLNIANAFFFGLCLALSIGLRANILPACLIMGGFFLFKLWKERLKYNIMLMAFGFSLILILPIHNYIFTREFIPLTIAAYKDGNLGASPSDYLHLFLSIIKLDFNFILWNKIINHINGEIKLYEFWYHIAITICFYCSFSKKIPIIIRCISLSSLSLIALILFYHVGGRYSYLTWTLSLFVLSYWMKMKLLPYLKRLNVS